MTLKIENISINKLMPYENNARKHTEEDVQTIINSIQEFGFNDPVGVWGENNIIVEGHGRFLAAKKLGIKEIPCIRLDELSDEQRKAYSLAHNKTAEMSTWDFDLLQTELDGIFDIDMSEFGFELNLDDNEPQEIVEDEVPEEVETRCKLGDLWQLGEHFLICGDSTDPAVIDRLMDGVKADMVMTDPPYGINAEKMTMGAGAKEFYRGEGWDSERPDISISFTLADNICIWGGNYFTDVLPISNDWLVWHKKNDGLSFSECELAWTNFGRNVRHISHHWGNEKKLHVTMKPVEVIAWAIQQAKEKAEVIVDLFGGSGSTLIACEQLNRKCYMCELDPHYCDVILQRYINLKGSDADVFLLKDGKKIPYSEVE